MIESLSYSLFPLFCLVFWANLFSAHSDYSGAILRVSIDSILGIFVKTFIEFYLVRNQGGEFCHSRSVMPVLTGTKISLHVEQA